MSLWDELRETDALMNDALTDAKAAGIELCRAEADYYTAKAQECFELKESGLPASFVAMVVKGTKRVSKAMERYHAAQVEYDNAREAVNVYKKRIGYLNEQIGREWRG